MSKGKVVRSLFIKGIIGGIVGFLVSMAWIALVDESNASKSLSQGYTYFVQNSLWLQCIITAILGVFAFKNFTNAKSLLIEMHRNEEDDSIEPRFDMNINKTLLMASLINISNFFLYGLSFNQFDGVLEAVAVLVFMGIMIIAVSFEVKSIALIQKKDPYRIADVSSFKFNQQWIETCDEAERLVMYKAAYKSHLTLQYALIVAMVVSLFAKLFADVSDFTLFVVAGLWLIHSLSYHRTVAKINKTKIEI